MAGEWWNKNLFGLDGDQMVINNVLDALMEAGRHGPCCMNPGSPKHKIVGSRYIEHLKSNFKGVRPYLHWQVYFS